MELTKQEAYDECERRMNHAADMIRAAALSAGFDYYAEVSQPRGPHGGWATAHIYWLNCMHYVEYSSDSTTFKIDDDWLYAKTGSDYKQVYE